MLIIFLNYYNIVNNHARTLMTGNGFVAHLCLLRPESVGYVTLKSDDPKVGPKI